MAKYEVSNPLLYLPRGDTVDDFAVKHIREINKIYSHLNAIRCNCEDAEYPTQPEGGQIRVEDDKFFIRNSANDNWVLMGEVKHLMGFLPSLKDRILTTADIATSQHEAGHLASFNDDGVIDGDITGSPERINGILIDKETDPSDGFVLVYRASENQFVFEAKLTGSEYEELLEMQKKMMNKTTELMNRNEEILRSVLSARDTVRELTDKTFNLFKQTEDLRTAVHNEYDEIQLIKAAVRTIQSDTLQIARKAEQARDAAIDAQYNAEVAVSTVEVMRDDAKQELADFMTMYAAQEPWDATKPYSPTDVVMLPDGSLYRAIGNSVGENPATSKNWVCISLPEKYWELDANGDIMPFNNSVSENRIAVAVERDAYGDLQPVN